MARSTTWAGWIAFAGWLMILIGSLEFFEGLIAVIRDNYYVLRSEQIIVFNMTTWGWLMMIWGVIVFLAGLGLLGGAGWARWFTIIAGIIGTIGQLSWLGASAYPLWALTVLALYIVVLYAVIVRWDEAMATRPAQM
jgi:hypothetical protein